MDQGLLDRYGGPVPRYTSYPTAPHFHDGVGAGAYRDLLAAVPDGERLSLYLHVPFCAEMCWYCGCHTKVVRRYGPIADYVRLLEREVEMVADAIPGRPAVAQIHWGGGTPSMLSDADFAGLMALIARRFSMAPDAEVAVEIDPRTLTKEMARALGAAGVNRASLGVQDFNISVQLAINRIQPYDMTARAVDWLRGAGIGRLNLDLMYGLPRQTVMDVLRSADLAADLGPDRLALFGYAHVPWMKRHQRLIAEDDLPGASDRFAQAEAAADMLTERGYRRIGLDHFSRADDDLAIALRAGRLRRNFQGYTADSASVLLGFGASAIGSFDNAYVQNAVPFGDYAEAIRNGDFAVRRGLLCGSDDRLRGRVIERLMCDLQVDLAELAPPAGPGRPFGPERALLKPLIDDGLAALDGDRLRVTPRGRPYLRWVCAVFDTYLAGGTARHSRAV